MTIDVTIKGLEREPETGFVKILHGKIEAKKETASIKESVTIFFDKEEDEFIPYEDLTQEEVEQWVLNRIDTNAFEKRLDTILNPPLEYGTPWDRDNADSLPVGGTDT